jgi:ABC-type lipoprotein release transport system permease subunit
MRQSTKPLALRVFGALFTVFAAVALALAAIRPYAAIAQTVTRRRHEIALRLAVGAGKAGTVRLVFAKGMRQLAIGLIVGIPAAYALSQGLTRAMNIRSQITEGRLMGAAITLSFAVSLAALYPRFGP